MLSEYLKFSFIGLKRKCLFKLAVVNKIADAEILCLHEELSSFKTSLFQTDFFLPPRTIKIGEEIRILQFSVETNVSTHRNFAFF